MQSSALGLDLPAIPRMKVDKVITLAERLSGRFLVTKGAAIDHGLALRWSQWVAETLDAKLFHVQESLKQYVGQTVTSELAWMLGYQFAARTSELDVGPLVAYRRPVRAEWIPIEVRSVTETVWHGRAGDRSGTDMGLFAMAGCPAGVFFKHKFPTSYLSGMAYKIGFSRRMTYDYDPRHFVGLRFWGYLQPRETPEVQFVDWAVTPAFRKANIHILRLRTRFEHELATCPHDYEHYCWDCPVSRRLCPGSCAP